MTAIKLERRTQAQGNNAENVSRVSLGRFKAGQRIVLRPRYVEFYLNATTIPGAGAFAEGPYLRITPETHIKNVPDTLDPCGVKPLKKSVFGGEVISGEAGPISIIAQSSFNEFFYEVDAIGNNVRVPFDCSVDLVTASAGMYVFDLVVYQDESPVPAQRQSNLTLTRSIPANTTRELYVPVGATEWCMSGNLAGGANLYLWQEDTGKLVLGYNSGPLLNGIIVGTRYSVAGCRAVRVQTVNQTLLTFFVALP